MAGAELSLSGAYLLSPEPIESGSPQSEGAVAEGRTSIHCTIVPRPVVRLLIFPSG